MEIIKVSSKSIPKKVAGSIASAFREGCEELEVQTIGAGAINQAIKSIIISRGFLSPLGIDLKCTPAFYDIIIDGKEKTAIKIIVKK